MGENEYLNKNPLFLELERGAADEEGKPEQETHSKDAAQGVAAIFKYSFSFSFLAQLLSVTVCKKILIYNKNWGKNWSLVWLHFDRLGRKMYF